MRYLWTAGAFLLALVVVGAVALVAVVVLAGPHSDMLPQWLQVVVFILGWVAVLGVPGYVARKVWLRLQPPRREAVPLSD